MSARCCLVTLGASSLATEQLVSLLVPGLSDDERRSACHALSLYGEARTAALRDHRAGARLVAALELGRRACMREVQRGARVRGVADAARMVRPLCDDDAPAAAVLALDERMRLVRAWRASAAGSSAVGALLRGVCAAGARRFVVGRGVAGPAVPSSEDVDRALELSRAARVLDGVLVDWLIVGDDGVQSLTRLGVLDRVEPRYR